MQRNLEQRYSIKFCVKLGLSATETIAKLQQAYGDEAMNRKSVFEWHRKFKAGREHVQDEQRTGRPVTAITEENVSKVGDLLTSNDRLTARSFARELPLSKSSVHTILKNHLKRSKVDPGRHGSGRKSSPLAQKQRRGSNAAQSSRGNLETTSKSIPKSSKSRSSTN